MPAPSAAQLDAILDRQGHEPCPGVEILPLPRHGDAPPAVLFRPAHRPVSPAPALLAFHGGGYQAGDPGGCGAIAKYLALTLGVTTLSSAYRLATADTPTFPAVLGDALAAWRRLQSFAAEWNVDPARVAVSGESAGVLLAAHLAVASPLVAYAPHEPRPAALVAQWGPLDFVARWFDLGQKSAAERSLLGGDYAAAPALYHLASPITHARGALPPAVFLYGENDPVVHPRQGRLGLAAWQAARVPAELHFLARIGHAVTGDSRADRRTLLEICARFLAVHLAPRPTPR
jgi:acetyl esterase/lipase